MLAAEASGQPNIIHREGARTVDQLVTAELTLVVDTDELAVIHPEQRRDPENGRDADFLGLISAHD